MIGREKMDKEKKEITLIKYKLNKIVCFIFFLDP